MKASETIASLDAQLAEHGQSVALRRGLKDAPTALLENIPAFVRGFKPTDIVPGGGISQNDSKAILSPSGLSGWPSEYPEKDDWIKIEGRFRSVLSVSPIRLANVLVRIELQVKG